MIKPKLSKPKKVLLRYAMYRLDWIEILLKAILARPTSWGENPVLEWRNASDEVMTATIRAMEKAKLIESSFNPQNHDEKI